MTSELIDPVEGGGCLMTIRASHGGTSHAGKLGVRKSEDRGSKRSTPTHCQEPQAESSGPKAMMECLRVMTQPKPLGRLLSPCGPPHPATYLGLNKWCIRQEMRRQRALVTPKRFKEFGGGGFRQRTSRMHQLGRDRLRSGVSPWSPRAV